MTSEGKLGWDQTCLGATNWMSISMAIFFPRAKRSTPSGMLKSTPKSSRFISVLAEKPAWVLPSPGKTWTPSNYTAKLTGLAIPLMVRSPSTTYPSPSGAMERELKSIWGCCSIEKKSVERRCASRSG